MLGIGGRLDVVCQIMKQWTILYSIWYSRSKKTFPVSFRFFPFAIHYRSVPFPFSFHSVVNSACHALRKRGRDSLAGERNKV